MLLEAKNVSKIYFPGRPNEVRALDGVSCGVERGEVVALSGPSGCGKTTLISLLASFERPTSGQIFSEGREITFFSEAALADLRRQKIGFVFQNFNLIRTLTAWENVSCPLIPLGVPWRERRRRAEELLRKFHLDGRFEHTPDQLSGGEQQRVALSRALIFSPEILIADEPTSNIDAEAIQSLKKIFVDLKNEGKSVVFATHEASLLEIADRRWSMRAGKITS